MFKVEKIFNVIFCVLVCLAPVVACADVDDSDCVMYNPAFALCSVHSHNVGYYDETNTKLPINPVNAEEVAYMNEVIALKATVIAQQLKEQYDELNAVVKRFKTQLEKAVLTSKIEVLTGNAASGNSGSGSGSSGSNNNGLANAEDCYAVTDQANVYDCFTRNLAKISQAVDNDLTGARKQLNNDIDIMIAYEIKSDSGKCDNGLSSKNNIKTCVQNLQVKVRQAKTKFDQENAKARWGR